MDSLKYDTLALEVQGVASPWTPRSTTTWHSQPGSRTALDSPKYDYLALAVPGRQDDWLATAPRQNMEA
jgi:hypothetical protein